MAKINIHWPISKRTGRDGQYCHSTGTTKTEVGMGHWELEGRAVGLAQGLQGKLSADAPKPCLEE